MPPHAPTLPLLGGLPFFMRDPLGFLERAATVGSIVDLRFPGRRAWLLSDPDDVEHVLLRENRSVIKDLFLRDLRKVVGDGLLTSEGAFWRRQRRLAQPAFHRERIAKYAEQMVASSQRLTDEIREGEVRVIGRDLMKLTLDIVVQTLFGTTVDGDAGDVASALDHVMHRYSTPLPLLVPGYDRLPLPSNFRFRNAVRTLDAIIQKVIDERRRSGTIDQGDLLSMLLLARDEDGSQMTDVQLRDEAMTIFLAGHETTANALSWTLMLLAQHPKVDAKLTRAIAFLERRPATLADLPKLAFVEHIATESMRLYPPAWAIGREVSDPFTLHGIEMPRGTQLLLSPWVTHRDARHFEAPTEFRPERWEDGLAKRLPRFAYFPFGGGPRLCIGNQFAMMELVLVLTTLAQRFRFDLAGAPPGPFTSVTLRPKTSLRVIPRARA